ncbi:acetyltransferase (GNAT) family protein [Tepidamorphus gemmatus]|uniref:Acetyltransferase (GNAT) family protein n=1 Tax=Tepidamorphus gemmatus TaxID=747076 RepID=A0A4R3MLM3_9HYPH|nr:GNAT family N-acetyltransferase [Tepidamorphus gemmatus]TCT13708.1 acetyltransferase (GNAT) family protein [Tepidamorphus gemmatus]
MPDPAEGHPGSIAVETLTGPALAGVIDDLARLRISVFRDYPYLYDGSLVYEARYLGDFAAIADAAVIALRDGGRLVGAATAAPLAGEVEAFRLPFERAGLDVSDICYFGESVLEPAYRGRGFGHVFFDGREAHARSLGLHRAAFCAVVRPDDHPLRPPAYRPLDGFWQRRGYAPVPGLICRFSWRDVGDAGETSKDLQVWMRDL